ncbi:phage tail tape measure protein [Zooshikella ganghwensis]|uniref:phage tail tape measure protein n=1 Tax=Zooshikella ganghwensis TaxID=202772 RepID=UPI000423AE33|nr:phage tail tape measure protein [Zooshikella ganghwensis]
MGSLGTYRKALSLVGDKTGYVGSMQREFENRAKTSANNLKLMQNGLTEIGIDLGSVVLPPLNTVINYVRQLTAKFVAFNQAHPMVTKAMMGIVATLIIGKVAAVGFGYAWTFIRGGLLSGVVAIHKSRLALMLYNKQLSAHRRLTLLSQVTGLGKAELMHRRFTRSVVAGNGVVRSLGTTMLGTASGGIKALLVGLRAITVGLLTTPIGWFISLIVAAGFAIYKYWDQVKAFFSGFMEGLNETLAPVKEALEPLDPLFNSIADGIGWVVDAIGDLFTPVNATAEELENAANAGRRFGQMVGNAIEVILLPLTTMLNTLKAIHDHMDIVINSPEKIPGLIWDNAKEKFSAVGNGISYAWDSMFGDEEESQQSASLKKQKIPPIKTTNTTIKQQNTSHITIVQQPGEDSEALARRVAKEEIKAQERQVHARQRGLLFDPS